MKILAVGDSYMPPRYFEQVFAPLEAMHEVEYFQVDDSASVHADDASRS